MSDSSPCSVPPWLRWLIPIENPGCQKCCAEHDETYRLGGSRADRLTADKKLKTCLIAAGMSASQADRYYRWTRAFGGPWLRRPYSWAFGNSWYAYDEEVKK